MGPKQVNREETKVSLTLPQSTWNSISSFLEIAADLINEQGEEYPGEARNARVLSRLVSRLSSQAGIKPLDKITAEKLVSVKIPGPMPIDQVLETLEVFERFTSGVDEAPGIGDS